MTATQPQLLQVALDPGDVVYTPDWVARDMVDYFKPAGRILDPCCGDGAFLRHLPSDTEWCEIERGRDFFAWHEHVDWVFGNPPYKTFSNWIKHSMEIADNICYLQIVSSVFISYKRLRGILNWGGIVSLRMYDNKVFDIPIGFNIGAFYFQRGYTGATTITMYTAP